MKTVSAFTARTNFGEILNQVYYSGEEIVVERKGKPLVKISRIDKKDSANKKIQLYKDTVSSKILSLAGTIKPTGKLRNLNLDQIRDVVDYSNL